jgi:hypothetical protein
MFAGQFFLPADGHNSSASNKKKHPDLFCS